MKRLIGVILAICLLFSAVTVSAGALEIPSLSDVPYQQLVDYLSSLDKDSLLDKLDLDGSDVQTAIDQTAEKLGLSKEDVAKAIEEAKAKCSALSECSIDWEGLWDEAKSKLPCVLSLDNYPSVTVKPSVDGLEISWTRLLGAGWYRVFVKSGSKWKKLTDVKGTSAIDTAVKSGTTYTYTVRAISNDRKTYTSDYMKDGASCTFIAAPKVTLSNAVNGVTVKWGKVTGAAKYRVFIQKGAAWKKLKDTAGTSVTDTSVKSGSAYTYTVRCISADGKSYTGDFLPGKKITFIAAPTFSLSNTKTGVKIAWSKVTGAAKYRVFIKSGTKWKKLQDITGTAVIHTAAKAGKTYTYTVRCISADGKKYTGAFRAGKSITCKK